MKYAKQAMYVTITIITVSVLVAAIEFLGFISAVYYQENHWILFAPLIIGIAISIFLYNFHRKLKKVEKIKSKFITVAAHRLRVPITRIKWTLDVLSETIQDKEVKVHMANMQKFLKEFVVVVNQMLDVSEIGKTSLFDNYLFTKERLEYIVRNVQALYSPGAKLKNITLAVKTEQDLPKINVDKKRLEEALGVFFENAILYTHEGGKIDIDVHKDKKSVIFSITDTGIGIEKDKIPYIFTKFFRTKEAMGIDMDRAGLGLSIAKEIIERHGGKIKVESKGKNHGSHFIVSLPIEKV